jgi:hypothetical protein
VTLYRSLLAFLASLSADPAEIDREPPRAAAAVAAAYASLAPEVAPTPPPAPAPGKCACGGKCANGVYKPDGRIEMKCEANCPCGCRKSPAPGR